MRFSAGKLITNLHKENTAVFFCDQVFPLFWSFIRIHILQLLGCNKENIIWKMFYSLGVFVPYLMLHMLDNFENPAYGVF